MSDYTTESGKKVYQILDDTGNQHLASVLPLIDLGTFLRDISKMTVETITATTTTLVLSKIPIGPVMLTKSDGSATYLQCGDDDTVAAGEFKVSDRTNGTITLHSGLSGYEMKCYYLGLTKGSAASAMYEALDSTFVRQ